MKDMYEGANTKIFMDGKELCEVKASEITKVKGGSELDNRYRKKPVVIEAIKLEEERESRNKVVEFIGDSYIGFPSSGGLIIKTLEGSRLARWGDYVIKGVNGEFYPCKPDIFEKTYDKVESSMDEPKEEEPTLDMDEAEKYITDKLFLNKFLSSGGVSTRDVVNKVLELQDEFLTKKGILIPPKRD